MRGLFLRIFVSFWLAILVIATGSYVLFELQGPSKGYERRRGFYDEVQRGEAELALTLLRERGVEAAERRLVDPAGPQPGLQLGRVECSHVFAVEPRHHRTPSLPESVRGVSCFAPRIRDPEYDYFTLFEFSAKYDPVATMLTQNHVNVVKGFMGQTTMFNRKLIKPSVVILGEVPNTDEVRYIHGNLGKGTYTFYGGHDPEDYTHAVGDPPTQLELHRNSPGYRLILNNILFPAARKKKLKT